MKKRTNKKARVAKVTQILIGFRRGVKVRIVRPEKSYLGKALIGKHAVLSYRIKDGEVIQGSPRRRRWLLKDQVFWLAEESMEIV